MHVYFYCCRLAPALNYVSAMCIPKVFVYTVNTRKHFYHEFWPYTTFFFQFFFLGLKLVLNEDSAYFQPGWKYSACFGQQDLRVWHRWVEDIQIAWATWDSSSYVDWGDENRSHEEPILLLTPSIHSRKGRIARRRTHSTCLIGGSQSVKHYQDFSSSMLTNSPNSWPPDRLFIIFNVTYTDEEKSSYTGYIESSMQAQFNKRALQY
jgi:hypothetical protein